MGSSTEKKLRKLFDFQRFEKDEKLQEVIDGTLQNANIRLLSDEELEFAAGGKEMEKENTKTEGYCASCGKMVPVAVFSGGRYRCTICKSKIEDETTIHYIKE